MNKQLLNDFLHQEECPHLLMDFGNPAFSERMLKEHLDQNSEFASRKLDEIERQVDFLYQRYLRPGDKVLDLACGPGLYTSMLANRQVHCGALYRVRHFSSGDSLCATASQSL